MEKVADESRISFLVIKKNRKPTAIKDYNDLVDLIEKVITPEFARSEQKQQADDANILADPDIAKHEQRLLKKYPNSSYPIDQEDMAYIAKVKAWRAAKNRLSTKQQGN